MKHPKTTILGVLTILSAILGVSLEYLKTGTIAHPTEFIALISGGWGLIKAADAPAA